MTSERQAEFRGKLFTMLGDRGQAQASASSASSSSSSAAREKDSAIKKKEGTDREHPVGPEGLRVTTTSVRTTSTDGTGTGSEGSIGVGRDRMQSPVGQTAVASFGRGQEGDVTNVA